VRAELFSKDWAVSAEGSFGERVLRWSGANPLSLIARYALVTGVRDQAHSSLYDVRGRRFGSGAASASVRMERRNALRLLRPTG
jgi:hypothetical protein